MSATLTRNKYLAKNLLVLDGLTGTGKTMMSNLLESYARMEVGRFIYDIEYISISDWLGAHRRDATKSLLGLIIDWKLYDNMISREVNFRPSDLSSVFRKHHGLKYIKRLFRPDGEIVFEYLEQEQPIMMINTHQLLAAIDGLCEQFDGKIHILEMERHPLYLLEHWMAHIDRRAASARDFAVWINDKDSKPVPWFARDWRDEYWSLTKFDRVVLSINSLTEQMDDQYQRRPKSQLMAIPFEDFVLKTDDYIGMIADWLGTKATSRTLRVCKKQNLPRSNINAGVNKKIYQRYGYRDDEKLQTHAENYAAKQKYARGHQSSVSAPILEKLIARYEARYGLWF